MQIDRDTESKKIIIIEFDLDAQHFARRLAVMTSLDTISCIDLLMVWALPEIRLLDCSFSLSQSHLAVLEMQDCLPRGRAAI